MEIHEEEGEIEYSPLLWNMKILELSVNGPICLLKMRRIARIHLELITVIFTGTARRLWQR